MEFKVNDMIEGVSGTNNTFVLKNTLPFTQSPTKYRRSLVQTYHSQAQSESK